MGSYACIRGKLNVHKICWVKKTDPELSAFIELKLTTMKLRLIHTALILLFGAVLILSCSKSKVTQPNRLPPPPPPPSLSGQEFQFDSLTWIFYDGQFDVGIDDIYLSTPRNADLFPWLTYYSSLDAQVFLKFDTASNWIELKSADLYSPSANVQYIYWISLNSLHVKILPLNYQLSGRKASVKIKFL